MENPSERRSPPPTAPAEGKRVAPVTPADGAVHPEHQITASPPAPAPAPAAAKPSSQHARKWVLLAVVLAGVAAAAYFLVPWVKTALNTVSTDDAYVNSHVTFVAPRVGGQVKKVFVDDNYRVKSGDLLVQLDKEPYQVQVQIKQAAVDSATW